MNRKAKIDEMIYEYDLCSEDQIPNWKQKYLVLLGVGVIFSINGIKQADDKAMYFYAYRNNIKTKSLKLPVMGQLYINTRLYRVEKILAFVKAPHIVDVVTNYDKYHIDYFKEFFEEIIKEEEV